MSFCTHCGAPLPGTHPSCARCGAPAPPARGGSSGWLVALAVALVLALGGSGVAAWIVLRAPGTTAGSVAVPKVPAERYDPAAQPVPYQPEQYAAPPAVVTPEAEPDGALDAQRSVDWSSVQALEGYWVPQLSSKQVGLVDNGISYDEDAILDDHLAMRSSYPGALLLWSGDFSTFAADDFWITVVGQPYTTDDGANGWCDSYGIGPDDCFAKFISSSASPEGSTSHR